MNPQRIQEVVGANLRDIREQFGITLSDVARGARDFGTPWSTGRVGDLESARGAVTVEAVIVLALTLSELSQHEISPTALLTPEGAVRIGGKASGDVPPLDLTAEAFRAVINGQKFSISVGDMTEEGQDRARDAMLSGIHRSTAVFGPGVTAGQIREARKAWSLADERAARKLGLGKETFMGQCIRVWGHLLSVEVEARSDPEDSPQKRGRVTRVLMDELQRSIHGND